MVNSHRLYSAVNSRPLRVCLNASIDHSEVGGIGDLLGGLVKGLSALDDGCEEYYFLSTPEQGEWLRVLAGDRFKFLSLQLPPPVKYSDSTLRRLNDLVPRIRLPGCPAALRDARIDVVHFPFQLGFRTSLPCIYQPHDLLHRHFPKYLSLRRRLGRERMYRAMCRQASSIVVVSSWVKDDLVQQYGITESKIAVVPYGPPNVDGRPPSKSELDRTRLTFRIPERFVFYPAQTWPHKNHVRLLQALALLRQRGTLVPLVCSGKRNEHFSAIHDEIQRLHLEALVTFVDYVDSLELRNLYAMARAVVMPSKFEAASFPVWEAFAAHCPVACSSVTSLPRQVGDAALLFNPESPWDISKAIEQLWNDDALCCELAQRGAGQVAPFTWLRTARHFRTLYRKLAGFGLTNEDRDTLASPPAL